MRDHLILSDIAVISLNHLLDWKRDSNAFSDVMKDHQIKAFSQEWHAQWKHWRESRKQQTHRVQISQTLMQDLWLMWLHPDVPVVRHLPWHFVIEDELYADLDHLLGILDPAQPYARQQWNDNYASDAFQFVILLERAYEEALNTRESGE